MFFELKSYLFFLIKSTNHHGVHSPFVYELTTKCLYANIPQNSHKTTSNHSNKKYSSSHLTKPVDKDFILQQLSSKKQRIVLKLISYLNPHKTVYVKEKLIQQLNTNKVKLKHQLVFFNKFITNKNLIDVFNYQKENVHNDSVFIIEGIHKSKKATEAWKLLCNNTQVTVSIDIFYFGLIFFRKEQEKEHFRIRV